MSNTGLKVDTVRRLARLAKRLEDHPEFMAAALAAYRKQERLDDQALAEHLRTSDSMLVRLALCKRPSSDAPEFAQQVREIAAYTGTDAGRLANMLRQIETLGEFLRIKLAESTEKGKAREAPLGSGLLAAARDHESSEQEHPESNAPEDKGDDVAG